MACLLNSTFIIICLTSLYIFDSQSVTEKLMNALCFFFKQAYSCAHRSTTFCPYGQPVLGDSNHHRTQSHAARGSADATDAG